MENSSPLPNKCQHCGLRVYMWHQAMGSAEQSDATFLELHALKKADILPSVPPRMVVPSSYNGGSTSFCAINAPAWSNRNTRCKYWQLKIPEAKLSDHLTIYHSKRNQEIATGLSVLALCVTVIIAIVQLST